ncbi:hypothetical protein NGK36_22740, partial [Hafnia alvei]|uniref:hypothetical protein n=1 Tax=Hafnia alvei TaxID=569 RepID=UPI002DB952A6
FLLKSQAFFFSEIRITAMLFSSSPSDVCVVVPGQWWRIIGTSQQVTSVYFTNKSECIIFHH